MPKLGQTDSSKYFEQMDRYQYVCVAGSESQAITGSTKAVALSTILATDIVLIQGLTCATTSYPAGVAITEGTGFVVTYNTSPGTGTFNYAVFRLNSLM